MATAWVTSCARDPPNQDSSSPGQLPVDQPSVANYYHSASSPASSSSIKKRRTTHPSCYRYFG
ncbi:hypothetical protein PGT21_009414 [Puccinia graminis f. sp. tritici]|uniref:Uncharacterized protein n=1 Tax=Puccinia graminis f. sp. tritici TaxID=56615 RepID=A0A5B0MIK7_PUCGR|nr:hypothetical protein PGT21_009414 [Puccinia graminis f. sp. tritici]